MGYDSLIDTLIKCEKDIMEIEWGDGLKIIAKLDTVFETDNGLESNDINFKEYDAAIVKVHHMITLPNKNEQESLYNWLVEEKNTLIELSLYEDTPSKISVDGKTMWRLGKK
ncbi:hypothetical protein M3580_09100 [Bacillus safensis]|uniref:hypothetical protein n=1 Tax=Bacillus safensis TaxID=561879 RepID=UPI00203C66A9|nr:hypothetical protein [Bacillus safensis]MCM2989388.1 hypothetical protein [Bacillus safensis]